MMLLSFLLLIQQSYALSADYSVSESYCLLKKNQELFALKQFTTDKNENLCIVVANGIVTNQVVTNVTCHFSLQSTNVFACGECETVADIATLFLNPTIDESPYGISIRYDQNLWFYNSIDDCPVIDNSINRNETEVSKFFVQKTNLHSGSSRDLGEIKISSFVILLYSLFLNM